MKPSFGRAVVGGFIGTAAMTAMMYTVAPMMGVKMDIAAMLGHMAGGWTGGMMLHILNGSVVFPVVYALVGYRSLRGPSALRGAVFGGLLWLVAEVVVMPMMGAGFFSTQVGGMVAAVASLASHVLYGVLLGVVAGGASAPGQTTADDSVHLSQKLHGRRG